MHTFARVGVFIQVRAIELRQATGVVRKVRRHPIQQHADAAGMAGLHEALQAFGLAKARTRCVQAQRLVAPGAIERMLADGQQLDVGETQLGDVIRQTIGQFVPGGKAPALAMAPGP